MISFIFLLTFTFATAFKDGHDHGCVKIQKWSQVEYKEELKDVCSYKCDKECHTVTEDVCINVPVEKCELVGYPNCQETKTIKDVRDDFTHKIVFPVTTCTKGEIVNINEVKPMPVCVDKVKEQCESKWTTDEATGEKVWAGNVNCQDVTWQDCTLVDTLVVEPVQTNHCRVTENIDYSEAVEVSKQVPIVVNKVYMIPSFYILLFIKTFILSSIYSYIYSYIINKFTSYIFSVLLKSQQFVHQPLRESVLQFPGNSAMRKKWKFVTNSHSLIPSKLRIIE